MISRSLNRYDLIVSGILNDKNINLDYPKIRYDISPYSISIYYKVIILCENGIMTFRIVQFNNGTIIYMYLKDRDIRIKEGYVITKEDYNNFVKAIELYYNNNK